MSLLPDDQRMLQETAAAGPVGEANRDARGQRQRARLILAKELDEQRNLDGAALRERQRVIHADAFARRKVDHLRADHALRLVRDLLQLGAEPRREDGAVRGLSA